QAGSERRYPHHLGHRRLRAPRGYARCLRVSGEAVGEVELAADLHSGAAWQGRGMDGEDVASAAAHLDARLAQIPPAGVFPARRVRPAAEVTLAGTPSARRVLCSPAASRSSRMMTLIVPLACLATVHAASWSAG